jgi:hypothetical protein
LAGFLGTSEVRISLGIFLGLLFAPARIAAARYARADAAELGR